MVIVDTHCHASRAWYEPVETLVFEMDRNGVHHALLVQINGQTNNEYQFECARRYPGRFVSIVLVDTTSPSATADLERLAAKGAQGVRFRATTRSPGNDPLAIWRKAADLGLRVSCLGASTDFASPEFARIVEALPNLTIIVEHLGSLKGHGDTSADEIAGVLGLSRYPNVCMKIPGLGEFCRRAMPVTEPFPFVQPLPTLLDQAYDAFGPDRLMWGSDFPPVAGREGYANALRLPMEQLASKSEADRQMIFGGTALRLFNFQQP